MKVFNLRTQEERNIEQSTSSASVIQAWLDDNEGVYPRPILEVGDHCIAFGDWVCLHKRER